MPDMLKTEIVIDLDAADCRLRDTVTNQKINEAIRLKQKHKYEAATKKHPFYVGLTAEVAFAKWLHVPYYFVPYKKNSADVMGYQIKATHLEIGSLIKTEDNPDGVYVLGIVNAALNKVTFKGWLLSDEMQEDCYWRPEALNPAYFVPQSELWSMSELTSTKELAAYHGWV